MEDLSENNKTNSKETPKMVKVRDDEGLNWDRADGKETYKSGCSHREQNKVEVSEEFN